MAAHSIDTSSLIEGWHRLYPPDNFEGVWVKLDEMIQAGELIASEEVLHDVKKKDDALHAWLSQRSGMFRETDPRIQRAATDVLAKFPRLLDTRKGRSASDPFVIGLALLERCPVVTQEGRTNSTERPGIPDACIGMGVKHMNLLQVIQAKGWKFAAAATF